MKEHNTRCNLPAAPRTISPETFQALHARPVAVLTEAGAQDVHAATLAQLDKEAAAMIEDATRAYNNYNPDLRWSFSGSSMRTVYDAETAANYAVRVEEELSRLAKITAQLEALREYYTIGAALLDSTEKRPAVILDRSENRWSANSGVSYEIHVGFYDLTRKRLIVQKRNLQHFAGKQHREARKAFAELLKHDPAALAFEMNNGWSESGKQIERPA